jgi:glycerol-3-phosphate dehydrogenase (NAD+)
MGANLADEVAAQHFSECTLACDFNPDLWNEQTRLIFHSNTHFRVQQVTDVITTEVCGALKNIYALGAGFIDALHLGSNTKAALLRIALMEIKTFCHLFFSSSNSPTSCTPETTLWESCGVADLITTCVGGRNRKCAETFGKLRLDRHSRVHTLNIEESIQLWHKIEQEVLQGQKLQGTWTCQEVTTVLQATHTLEYFPLLYTIYKIAFLGQAIESIVDGIVTSPSSLLPKRMSLGLHHRLEKSRL